MKRIILTLFLSFTFLFVKAQSCEEIMEFVKKEGAMELHIEATIVMQYLK